MILDKNLLDFQYAEAMRAVCAKCDLDKTTLKKRALGDLDLWDALYHILEVR